MFFLCIKLMDGMIHNHIMILLSYAQGSLSEPLQEKKLCFPIHPFLYSLSRIKKRVVLS